MQMSACAAPPGNLYVGAFLKGMTDSKDLARTQNFYANNKLVESEMFMLVGLTEKCAKKIPSWPRNYCVVTRNSAKKPQVGGKLDMLEHQDAALAAQARIAELEMELQLSAQSIADLNQQLATLREAASPAATSVAQPAELPLLDVATDRDSQHSSEGSIKSGSRFAALAVTDSDSVSIHMEDLIVELTRLLSQLRVADNSSALSIDGVVDKITSVYRAKRAKHKADLADLTLRSSKQLNLASEQLFALKLEVSKMQERNVLELLAKKLLKIHAKENTAGACLFPKSPYDLKSNGEVAFHATFRHLDGRCSLGLEFWDSVRKLLNSSKSEDDYGKLSACVHRLSLFNDKVLIDPSDSYSGYMSELCELLGYKWEMVYQSPLTFPH